MPLFFALSLIIYFRRFFFRLFRFSDALIALRH